MTDYYEYSIPELVRMMGERFRDCRLRAHLTQREVAKYCALSVTTVHKFENGTATGVTLGTFLLLMKAVGCINQLEHIMPEMPVSPYALNSSFEKIQRVRHKAKKE